jgi:hypothetical protein
VDKPQLELSTMNSTGCGPATALMVWQLRYMFLWVNRVDIVMSWNDPLHSNQPIPAGNHRVR